MKTIDEAKEILKKHGYFINNLWHINDIKDKYNCSDDELAQSILYSALTNESVMEHIWDSIDMIAQEEELKLKDE